MLLDVVVSHTTKADARHVLSFKAGLRRYLSRQSHPISGVSYLSPLYYCDTRG